MRRAVFAIGSGLLLAVAGWSADASVSELLGRHGLRVVDPPVPAYDVSLPDLTGDPMALSELQGRWAIVTFFATWCGPCRQEMPSLEALHHRFGDRGLALLGISTDDSPNPVGRFVRDLGVTFPILWDRDGDAARIYRASSIPLTYLLDPTGAIVGAAVGARDWSRLGGLMEQLLELRPPTRGGGGATTVAYVPPAGTAVTPSTGTSPTGPPVPVGAPVAVEPPVARFRLNDPMPRPGATFTLDVEIGWSGGLEELRLHPPRITLPEGVELEGMSASSRSGSEESIVVYRARLVAATAGRYAIGPIEILYTPRGETGPIASQIDGPTLEVAKARAGLTTVATVGGLGAGAVLVVGLLAWRRRRHGVEGGTPGDWFEALTSRLAEVRRCRLEGDAAGFLRGLLEVERELGSFDAAGADRRELEEAIERATYGGERPVAELLDRHERRVVRAVEACRPKTRRRGADAVRPPAASAKEGTT